jgi:hypothetical protein
MNTQTVNVYGSENTCSLTGITYRPLVASLPMTCRELIESYLDQEHVVVPKGSSIDAEHSDRQDAMLAAYYALPVRVRLGL